MGEAECDCATGNGAALRVRTADFGCSTPTTSVFLVMATYEHAAGISGSTIRLAPVELSWASLWLQAIVATCCYYLPIALHTSTDMQWPRMSTSTRRTTCTACAASWDTARMCQPGRSRRHEVDSSARDEVCRTFRFSHADHVRHCVGHQGAWWVFPMARNRDVHLQPGKHGATGLNDAARISSSGRPFATPSQMCTGTENSAGSRGLKSVNGIFLELEPTPDRSRSVFCGLYTWV